MRRKASDTEESARRITRRGLVLGGAQVSEKHTNFLINTGDASSSDIEGLGEEVRRRVAKKSGVALEWEIKRLGRFEEGREVTVFAP